jgi:hypothetical protein
MGMRESSLESIKIVSFQDYRCEQVEYDPTPTTTTTSTTTTLPPTPPTVETNPTVSGISETGATSGGQVTSLGSAAVTARGVQWSGVSDFSSILGTTTNGAGLGSFVSTISGLSRDTTYFVRAYATNSAGTSYGEVVAFATLSELPCSGQGLYTGGPSYPYSRVVDLGTDVGYVKFNYDAINVPDRFIVRYNGSVVIDTGYRGSNVYDFGIFGFNRSQFTESL